MTPSIPKPSALTPIFENIPDQLKEYPNFVVWRFDWSESRQAWTKVLYSPKTGRRARSHNSAKPKTPYTDTAESTWGTFEEAKARHERGGFDGIGFVFGKDDPFLGCDVDKCLDPKTGTFDDRATFALAFVNTYSEISPSGTGVKFICCADMPGGRGRNGGGVEMYGSQRFFTLTGHRLTDYPATVEERQGHIKTLHEEWFGKEPEKLPTPLPSNIACDTSDQEIIDHILRNPRSAALWRGDFSAYVHKNSGKPDQTPADLALCGHLAFFIGSPDAGRIDRLFRQSGLMRGKWDDMRGSESYGEGTIQKSLSGRTEYFGQQYGTFQAGQAAERKILRAGGLSVPTVSSIDAYSDLTETEEAPEKLPQIPTSVLEPIASIACDFEIEDYTKSSNPAENEEFSRLLLTPLDSLPTCSDFREWVKRGWELKDWIDKAQEDKKWRLGAWYESIPYGEKEKTCKRIFGNEAYNIIKHYAPTFRAWREIGLVEGMPFGIHEELQGVKSRDAKMRWASEYRRRDEKAKSLPPDERKGVRLTIPEIRDRLNTHPKPKEPKGWAAVKAKNFSEKKAEKLVALANMIGEVEADYAFGQWLDQLYAASLPKEESTYDAGYDGLPQSGQELCEDARLHIEKNERQRLIEDGNTLQEAEAILSDTLAVVAVPLTVPEAEECIEEHFDGDFSDNEELESPSKFFASNSTHDTVIDNKQISEEPPVSSSPPLRFAPAVISPEEPIPDELPETFAPYRSVIDAARSGELPKGKIAITSYLSTDNLTSAVKRAIDRQDTTSLQLYQAVWEQQNSAVPMLC